MTATPTTATPTVLTEALRREGVADARTDALTIGMYATDAGIYRVPPRAVVFPRHTDEIAATLAVARELGVPVTTRGAGTSCAGNAVGPGIVIDTARHLGRVLEVDRDARTFRLRDHDGRGTVTIRQALVESLTLPVVLPQDAVDALMRDAGHGANARITVDLERQVVTGADGTEYPFQIDPHRRHNMLEGLDDIGLTLGHVQSIDSYETSQRGTQPWLWA